MTNARDPKVVLVSGDATVDWNLARFRPDGNGVPASTWWGEYQARACWQAGGAALLAGLVAAVGKELRGGGQPGYSVQGLGLPRRPHPGDERFHHSYAIWTHYPEAGKAPGGEPDWAWRVERFLGLDRATDRPSGRRGGPVAAASGEPGAEPELVLLDDANLGFRDEPSLWPAAVEDGSRRPWILVKMAWPVARGPLWDDLHRNHADRLIAVTTVNDIRRTEVQISRELSWERTAQDVLWELTHNPNVNTLARSAHVVVSFDTVGALLLSRGGGCTLFFDPGLVEGMWNQSHPGGMIGYTSCLAAAIAHQVLANPDQPDLASAIQAGAAGMRLLHGVGYEERLSPSGRPRLAFPFTAVAREILTPRRPLAAAPVQDPVRFLGEPASEGLAGGYWTILQDRYPGAPDALAEQVVLKGAEAALDGVPLGRFDKLVTADRREIEGLRSIRALISEYCARPQSQPLSIAVFGPPGSGKSFGVKQVAGSVKRGEVKPLEFNLSQFAGPENLLGAFHQVRDAALSGQVPLVFWDEFDSILAGQPFGWLRSFLSPMQDGAFRDGQVSHPIGRAIFVFAGGTCTRMEDFGAAGSAEEFIRLKGPDFVSRLRGYVNVLGPNPQVAGGLHDPHFVVRRAIMFRFMLEREAPHVFGRHDGLNVPNIDPGVLRAFLGVSRYKHGARSMEAIIGMSLLAGKTKFERSALPAEAQLDLHVDGLEFLALAQRLELGGTLLETLAEAAHDIFREGRRRDGWKLGARDNGAQTHPLLVPYAELPETYKEANRVTVRNIPTKLAVAGYVMMPARSGEPPFQFPGDALERLSRLEHDLWTRDKLARGFSLGEPSAEDPKRSPYLVEWGDVPENIKESDRDLVRGIPRILAKAGYAVLALKRVRDRA